MSLVVRMGAEASSAAAFALVRDIPGLEVAFSSDAVWLRDQSGDASNLQRLRVDSVGESIANGAAAGAASMARLEGLVGP